MVIVLCLLFIDVPLFVIVLDLSGMLGTSLLSHMNDMEMGWMGIHLIERHGKKMSEGGSD